MLSRPSRGVLAAVLSIAVAACGPSSAVPPTASSLISPSAGASGSPSVLPVPVSSELHVGANRTIFSLADPTGQKPVAAPDRTLAIGYRGPSGEIIAATPQTFVWAVEGVNGVYVGDASFASAGVWIADFATEAPGSAKETMSFSFDVKQKANVVSPGEAAPSVRTPTLADVGGDVAKVSTDATPVKRFYETSEADALAAKKPFVLIFATPKFCQSATCGPTLDKLKSVAAAHPELTFINVEPYELKDVEGQLQPVTNGPDLVPVEATKAFRLSSEPYVFVVGSDGIVSASFELVFSPAEIEAAIRALE
ncbi:MAG TPA: hypothetical protein VM427_05485 [Patescibacteria group bacterium]|nr:hypothetical protein [Patescibacteria group bacterium]